MANEQKTETIWVHEAQVRILENAERLLADAELLHMHGRHPSALAMAILAFEEIGKIYLLGIGELHSKGRNGHRTKQQFANAMLIAGPAISVLADYLASLGMQRTPQTAVAFLYAVLKSQSRSESEEDKMAFQRLENQIIEEVAERLRDLEAGRVSIAINSGRANALKQSGFYCDVDESGRIISDPNNIGSDLARDWIDRARFVVDNCRQSSTRDRERTKGEV